MVNISPTHGWMSSTTYLIQENNYFNIAPCLVIEVLSPSTERIDRTEKLTAYQTIESLQEYVLIAQDCERTEVYQRKSTWQPEVFESSINLTLQSVDLVLSVDAVYV